MERFAAPPHQRRETPPAIRADPGTLAADMAIEIPGFDGFTEIGSGGFSKVYEARDLHHGRQVAIKVLTIDAQPGFDKTAFAGECSAQGAVSDHPHIVTLHGSGIARDGRAYIVMELYRRTLLDLIRGPHQSPRPLPVDVVLDLGIKIGGALRYSHEADLIHGDIKPQNILYSRSANEPALGDFGIAAWLGDRSGSVLGLTRAYAAPEVLDDAPPSPASDLYSLGATLYTALAGARPFRRYREEASDDPMEDRIMNEPPPPISAQTVPGDIEDFIATMMAKAAGDRPASANEVIAALANLRSGVSGAADTQDVATDGPPRGERPIPPEHGHDRAVDIDDGTIVRPGTRKSSTREGAPDPPAVTPLDPPMPSSEPAPHQAPWLHRRNLLGLAFVAMMLAVIGAGWTLARTNQPVDQVLQTTTTSTTTRVVDRSPPSVPIGLIHRDLDDGRVEVSWDQVTDAARYQVDFVLGDAPPLHVDTALVVLDPAESAPYPLCVVVRAVNAGSQMSPPSIEFCPNG